MQNAIRSSVSILSYYSSSAIPNRKYSIYNRNTDIARSAGSGVIMSLDDDGNAYIITNYHVTYTQQKTYSKVFVLLCEDSQFINTLNYAYVSDEFNVVNSYTKAIDAEYVGGSLEYDIAVLKISASDRLKEAKANNIVVAASLADPNEDLVFGQECYAVGNALNAGMTITRGIVSVPYEEINVENVENTTTGIIHRAIRTDAAINSGNSGGGFFDTNGNLIGIVFAKSSSSSVEDIGDVIPLSVALNVYNKILKDCDGTTVKPTFYDLGYEYEYTCNAKYNASSGIVELEESVYVSKISSSEYNDLSIGDQITGVQIVYSDGSATGKIEVNHYYTVEDLLLTASSGDTMIIYYTKTSTGAQNQELSVTFKSAQ
jgi:serine protease Do